MFDLDARIHFDKVKLVRVRIDQKFDRACILIADFFTNRDRSIAQRLTNFRQQVWGRSNFNDLLVTSLHRTITFIQVHQIAVLVAEQLDLDMPGMFNKLFDKHLGAAKSRQRFA